MSAIPITAPRPTPSLANSTTTRSAIERHADSATFNAHLHEVQHQRSQEAEAADSRPSSDRPSTAVSSDTSSDASHGKTGALSSEASADDSVGADGALPVANQVLGLIQQSSGNAAAASTVSTDDKPAAGKTLPQSDDVKPVQPAVTGLPMPSLMPAPVNAGQAAASPGDSGATGAAKSLSTAVAASAQAPGKAARAFPALDEAETASADAAGGDNDSVAALVPGTDAAAHASVNTFFGNAHNATAAATDTVTPAAGQPQEAGDLATLRSALATPVLVTSTTSSAAPHSLNISANVTSPTFSQELGQQVSWLGGQEIKQAQIRLNPQELGPLDVKVSIEHGRVDVVFAAQHPATVTAVQQSLGQLNQMLGGHGLSLGQATVGQHTAQQQFDHSQRHASSTSAQANDAEPTDTAVSPLSAPLAIGLVDAFA